MKYKYINNKGDIIYGNYSDSGYYNGLDFHRKRYCWQIMCKLIDLIPYKV